jgi:hypothetical protein
MHKNCIQAYKGKYTTPWPLQRVRMLVHLCLWPFLQNHVAHTAVCSRFMIDHQFVYLSNRNHRVRAAERTATIVTSLHACYTTYPLHPPRFYCPNKIWWPIQFWFRRLPLRNFLLPLRPTPSQRPALKSSQPGWHTHVEQTTWQLRTFLSLWFAKMRLSTIFQSQCQQACRLLCAADFLKHEMFIC